MLILFKTQKSQIMPEIHIVFLVYKKENPNNEEYRLFLCDDF